MLDKTYDIIIIGAGPGGYVAAIRAAQLGAKVLIIEKDEVGGVCLNRGCVPTKVLIASVATRKTLKRAGLLGIEIQEAKFNLAKVLERKKRVVEQLREGIKFLFKKSDVELIKGVATIKDKRSVVVKIDDKSRQELKTKKIIVATGSESLSLPQFSFDGKKIISSTEALNLTKVPQSILIIGAGAVGVEFATIFSGLGAKVILIEMLPHIIPNEDEELSRELEKFFKIEGIEVLTSTKIEKIISEGERLKVITDSGKELIVEKILVAVGRKLNSQNIGLENVGVKTEGGKILVNRKMQTNISDIYAIGDVTGGTLLAHKASKEGIVAAESSLGLSSTMDYSAVPSCIYTLPEVASVGMTEEKARAEEIKVKIGKFPFSASGKAIIQGEGKGFVKIVAEAESGRVLGVQIIGYKATDLIAIGVLAVRFKMTLHQLSHAIFAHPTLSETLMEAAEAVEGKAIHK
jgi:dihydrolipoamide dehydrogenase